MYYEELKERANHHFPEMVEIRRHLHQYPELSYQEEKTTEYIVEKLKEMDIPCERPLNTGCVGVIEGKEADGGPVVALRADIDALAIDEEGTHKSNFISRHPGVAHCCGHDAHTANLLGAASILKDFQHHIRGRVLLIFQPGEEKLPGGGRILCEHGFLQEQDVDVIYGLHTYPDLEPGQIGVRSGPLMARPDEFNIVVRGSGGHAAAPHDTVDPIVVASEIVGALQTISSRSIDPNEPSVVTVGKIEAGSAHNIIPEFARMIGTVRSFSEETAQHINQRMERIVDGITHAHGASYEYQFDPGYPALVNTEWAVDRLRAEARKLHGDSSVRELEKPVMAGEDFAFYLQHFPGAFFFLGTGSEESGSVYSWHHPKYNIDEQAFKTGAPLMAAMALNFEPPEKN